LIPESTKEKAFALWLAGNGYNTVTKKTEISQGSLNKILEAKRASIPGLDNLRKNNVLVLRLSEEKGKDFVDAAKRLLSLEEKTGKPCEELVKEFEGLVSRVLERKKEIKQLNNEKKDLKQDTEKIKATFSAQNLSFDEGLKLVTGIENLKDETELWTNSLDASKSDFEEAEKELIRVKNISSRFQKNRYLQKTTMF